MNTHFDKTKENERRSEANNNFQKQSNIQSTFQFIDNRPETVTQHKLQEMTNRSDQAIQFTKCDHCNKNVKKCKCPKLDTGDEAPSAQEWWEKNLSNEDRTIILRKMGTHEQDGGLNKGDETTAGSKKGDSHGNSSGEAKSDIFRIYNSDPKHFMLVKNWNDKTRVKGAKKKKK